MRFLVSLGKELSYLYESDITNLLFLDEIPSDPDSESDEVNDDPGDLLLDL